MSACKGKERLSPEIERHTYTPCHARIVTLRRLEVAETEAEPQDYLTTGISGLDAILYGGFLRSGFYLLQGNPGSGKTTLSLQFLLACARRGERGLYISLTESRQDLVRTCRSHGWDIDAIAIADLTRSAANLKSENQYSVFHPSEVELGQTTQAIFAEVERVQPRCVVFDGLSEMRLLAERPLRYRHQMLALKAYFEDRGITVLLLDDQASPLGDIQPESLVGGNIIMERYLPGYGGARRRMYVTKVRGAAFRDGYHDYDIQAGGLVIYPRLIAAEHHETFTREVQSSGIDNLDTMLDGGLQAGTTTLLLGPTGAGKSTIAMQFVAQALVRGESAAVYTFDEVLETLFERSEKLCFAGVRQYVANGQLHAQQVNPAELSPGAFTQEVRRAVEEAGAKVIVIDSLNGYLSAMPEERFLTTHLHELFAYLNQRGVLTLLVVAQHGLLGAMVSEVDVSYMADTVLLLRYYEMDAEIRQAISVIKKRTGAHARALRELKITTTGVQVGEPLVGFRGILTGVPEYQGTTKGLPGEERNPR
jgi:circadian clock protein KaiC